MATFKMYPEFKQSLIRSVENFAEEYAQMCRSIIETERFWQGWETSNPVRDIVDTNALNESMLVERINDWRWRISWSTAYVVFVYMGYTLADGRRIPARQWCDLAIDENNLLETFRRILQKNL